MGNNVINKEGKKNGFLDKKKNFLIIKIYIILV